MTEATGGVAARDQLDIRTRDGERKKGLRTFTRHSGYIYRLLRDGHGVWLSDGRTNAKSRDMLPGGVGVGIARHGSHSCVRSCRPARSLAQYLDAA